MPPRRTLTKLLRFHPAELAVIAARAQRCGRTPARFIREAALGAIPKPRHHTDRDQLLRDLARIGSSLATLATRAGDPGYPGDMREPLSAALVAHRAAVESLVHGAPSRGRAGAL